MLSVYFEELIIVFYSEDLRFWRWGLEGILLSAAVASCHTGQSEWDLDPPKHLNPSESEKAEAGDIPPPPPPPPPSQPLFSLSDLFKQIASENCIGSAVLSVHQPSCFLKKTLHLSELKLHSVFNEFNSVQKPGKSPVRP